MRKYLPLFFAGALMDLALAPFYLFPVLFFSFPYFFIKLQRAETGRQAFWTAWWFGFGYFIFGLYWISNSLLVDLRFAWLIPFAISLIPAAAAIFTGLVGYVYKKLRINSPVHLVLLWLAAEYIKGYFPFGGFPWNNIGYASLFSEYYSQVASIGGVYFAGFCVMMLALLPVYYKSLKGKIQGAIFMVVPFVFGFLSIMQMPSDGINKTVTIIQPNIEQTLKWDPNMIRLNFFDTLTLAAQSDSDITIWPESSVPFQIDREPAVREKIGSVTPEGKITVTSSTRMQGNYEKIWNSLYVIDSNSNVLDTYDKHHLVPFGEYVPFRNILPIDKVTPGMMDFSAGKEGKTITANGMKFLPLICYEIIFPHYANGDYDFIVNTTNDAWFGNSTGPQQHLAMAQMRAIEQGRPVLRAANTGVSAVIDPFGRVLKKLPYGKQGVIKAKIPLKVETIYNQFGDLIFLFLLLSGIISIPLKRKRGA